MTLNNRTPITIARVFAEPYSPLIPSSYTENSNIAKRKRPQSFWELRPSKCVVFDGLNQKLMNFHFSKARIRKNGLPFTRMHNSQTRLNEHTTLIHVINGHAVNQTSGDRAKLGSDKRIMCERVFHDRVSFVLFPLLVNSRYALICNNAVKKDCCELRPLIK